MFNKSKKKLLLLDNIFHQIGIDFKIDFKKLETSKKMVKKASIYLTLTEVTYVWLPLVLIHCKMRKESFKVSILGVC